MIGDMLTVVIALAESPLFQFLAVVGGIVGLCYALAPRA